MKLKNPMLVVTDMDRSVEFYKNCLLYTSDAADEL